MWSADKHTFLVLTKRYEAMVDWVWNHAAKRSHGWTDSTQWPVYPGEYFHMDDIVMRRECGWLYSDYERDVDFGCRHPNSPSGECDHHECPLVSPADSRADLETIGVAGEYEFDGDGFAEDCEWVKFESRPRNGAARNVWLGCTVCTQEELERATRAMRRLRWLWPGLILWLSVEPMLEPLTFKFPYYEDGKEANWSPLENYHFQGLPPVDVPYINWVVVGAESGPKRRPCERQWILGLCDQCEAAGVPCFVKQAQINGQVVHDAETIARWLGKQVEGIRQWPDTRRINPVEVPHEA
jgi:protein gp37